MPKLSARESAAYATGYRAGVESAEAVIAELLRWVPVSERELAERLMRRVREIHHVQSNGD